MATEGGNRPRLDEEVMQDPNAPQPSDSNPNKILQQSFSQAGSPRTARGRRKTLAGGNTRPIPTEFVLKHLEFYVESRRLVGDLFIYLPFLVMFVFFFLAGRNVGDSYFVVNSMRDLVMGNEFPQLQVPKFFEDIAISDDWDLWMEGVVVQNLWTKNTPYHYNTSDSVHYAGGQNILLGNMRIRTLRMSNNSCVLNPHLYPGEDVLTRECYGKFQSALQFDGEYGQNNHTFKWLSSDKVSGTWTTGEIDRYPPEGYVEEIDFRLPLDGAIAAARRMVDGKFVDNTATRFVAVEFFIYTPSFNTFTSVKLICEVTAGGSWVTTSQLRLFKVWTSADRFQTIYDFFFLAFVIYYVIDFFRDFRDHYRKTGRLLGFITQLWNFLELVNLVVFLAVFIMRWIWWNKSRGLTLVLPFTGTYPGELEPILYLYSMQVYFNSVNTVLSFLKLLKFVRLNDRLNILTRTMEACQQNIIGVLILFIFVVFGYSITGNTLFGNAMWEWRNLSASFSTLMRMLLGDFDYNSMRQENRFLAGLFFWSFVILGLFLLLNFIIAIIADSFADVNREQSPVSLDEQIIRSLSELKKSLRPSSLAKRLCSFGKNSQASLLTEMISTIAQWGEMQRQGVGVQAAVSFAEQEDEEQCVHLNEIMKILPAELVTKIGTEQIHSIWEDVEYEYELYLKNDSEAEKKEHQDRIRRGVVEALDEPIQAVADAAGRIAKLENMMEKVHFLLNQQRKLEEGSGPPSHEQEQIRAPLPNLS